MKKHKISLYILLGTLFIFIISIFLFPLNLKQIPNSEIIYDTNGIEIWEIIKDDKIRHRNIKIDEIPDFTKDSIILMEDKNFRKNIWIDFYAIFRAFYKNIKSWEISEWASTISTQVIRNNYWLNSPRTYKKKISEFYLALVLNAKYSKDEILEYYLNNIYFWYLNYWIDSASKYYFWKDLKNLTQAEQMALLIIPKNPNIYDPYKNKDAFRKRFDSVINYLNNSWLINDQEFISIKNEILEFNYEHKDKLTYISAFLKSNNLQKDLNNINTTIDYNLTKKIDELAKNAIIPIAWKDVWDYWVLIIDRKTNDLKVMIWWIDYFSENWQVNITTSNRQPGSSIKPFTYVLAFSDLWYKPETTILDLPIQFETKEWYSYSPKNYSLDYKWEITIAQALSQSINIPAVKLLSEVWVARLYNFLKQLKINSLNKDPDYYWLALTLWVWEVSLYELLQAYSIFANDWNFCETNIIKDSKKNCKKVIEKKYTDMVYKILINRYFKLEWFPINSSLDFPDREVFVKTGTSRNFRDNWSLWFTQNYMIWVWAWNKDWTNMKWVSWATWAWEIFRKIVYELEKENNKKKEEIVFLENKNDFLEIISPLNQSNYKIDKTKPDNIWEIKLSFQSNLDYDNYEWFINWKKYNSDFFRLIVWSFEIKIVLYKNWEIIWENISNIDVWE